MRAPGEILLVACYELGHQPLAAGVAGGIPRASRLPAGGDGPLGGAVRRREGGPRPAGRRLGADAHGAPTGRGRSPSGCARCNPRAHLCFFGLYAGLNAAYLFAHGADSVISGEVETPLVNWRGRSRRGDSEPLPFVHHPATQPLRISGGSTFPCRAERACRRSSATLSSSATAVTSRSATWRRAAAACTSVATAPFRPCTAAVSSPCPRDVVLADIRQQVAAGARHITFGDPDFLNGPTHALAAPARVCTPSFRGSPSTSRPRSSTSSGTGRISANSPPSVACSSSPPPSR